MDTDQVSGRWDANKGACPTRQVLGRIGDIWVYDHLDEIVASHNDYDTRD
jgi:hypothetical protein